MVQRGPAKAVAVWLVVLAATRVPAGVARAAARNLSAPGGSAAEPAPAVAGDGSAAAAWERFAGSRFAVPHASSR